MLSGLHFFYRTPKSDKWLFGTPNIYTTFSSGTTQNCIQEQKTRNYLFATQLQSRIRMEQIADSGRVEGGIFVGEVFQANTPIG